MKLKEWDKQKNCTDGFKKYKRFGAKLALFSVRFCTCSRKLFPIYRNASLLYQMMRSLEAS